MEFRQDSKIYKPSEENAFFSDTSSDSKCSSIDQGFYSDFDFNKVAKRQLTVPLNVGTKFFVNRGLTVLLGPPGAGKSTFIREKMSKEFLSLQWGEPEAPPHNHTINALLRLMDDVMVRSQKGSGVIDSVMPLIISSSDNLGQGGLSKRVLSYIRQLSSISWAANSHLVLVMNPLETGEVLSIWTDYVKAVAHSVCLVVDQKAYLSSRITDPRHANVPPGRVFGSETGETFNFGSSNVLSNFAVAEHAMKVVSKNAPFSMSDSQSSSAFDVTQKYSKFPRLR